MDTDSTISLSITQNLLLLKKELKDKKEELDCLRSQIKDLKKEYTLKVEEYSTYLNIIIEDEKQKEKFLKQKNKKQKTKIMLFLNLNARKLQCIKNQINFPSSQARELILYFFDYHSTTFENAMQMLKTPEELKDILSMSLKRKLSAEEISFITESVKKIENVGYPFDTIIQLIQLKLDLCYIDNKISNLAREIDSISETKNNIFLYLKRTEGEISKKIQVVEKIMRYIKTIYAFFEKYNKIKNERTTNNTKDDYCELAKSLREFKTLTFKDNTSSIYDNFTSLTIRSEISDNISSYSISDYKLTTLSGLLNPDLQNGRAQSNKITSQNHSRQESKKSLISINQVVQSSKEQSTNNKIFCGRKIISKPVACKSVTKKKNSDTKQSTPTDEDESGYLKTGNGINENEVKVQKLELPVLSLITQGNKESSFFSYECDLIDDKYSSTNLNQSYLVSPMNNFKIKPSKFFDEKRRKKGRRDSKRVIFEGDIDSEGYMNGCHRFCFFG